MSSDLVGVITPALVKKTLPGGAAWRMRPATVLSVTDDGNVTGRYDGDSAEIRMISLIGRLGELQRVMCMFVPPAGNYIVGTIGDLLNLIVPGDIIFSGATPWTAYTPVVGNEGTATWSTLVGRWRRVAPKTVHMAIYAVVDNAGSGAGNVTMTAPTSILRTIRQAVPGQSESPQTEASLVAFTGGSGAVWDRIRVVSATITGNITGADLVAGRLLNFSGIYEES